MLTSKHELCITRNGVARWVASWYRFMIVLSCGSSISMTMTYWCQEVLASRRQLPGMITDSTASSSSSSSLYAHDSRMPVTALTQSSPVQSSRVASRARTLYRPSCVAVLYFSHFISCPLRRVKQGRSQLPAWGNRLVFLDPETGLQALWTFFFSSCCYQY